MTCIVAPTYPASGYTMMPIGIALVRGIEGVVSVATRSTITKVVMTFSFSGAFTRNAFPQLVFNAFCVT